MNIKTTKDLAEYFGMPRKAMRVILRRQGIRCGSGNRHQWTDEEFEEVIRKCSAELQLGSAKQPTAAALSGSKPYFSAPQHFRCRISDQVAIVNLDRPERKNPLTFESYAELRDWFGGIRSDDSVSAVLLLPNGGNFCSGGDVHEIIGPLTRMSMKDLLGFTRMTGDLVKAMIHCGKPIIAAIDGVCAGAGAIIAMASDLRLATPEARTSFLFNRVGLAGCDMGACAMLPRIIGQGRAAELLYLGRSLGSQEGYEWGFFNQIVPAAELASAGYELACKLVEGPGFANMMTKTMLAQEWSMSLEQAIESEAQAQAICMQTNDFAAAYEAFRVRKRPVFGGQ